jgi:hypothetical protein
MRLCIPSFDQELVLTQDWNFRLFYDYDNKTLLEKFGFEYDSILDDDRHFETITLPVNSILEICGYDIGPEGYRACDSIDFMIKSEDIKCTFWTKLEDANNVHCSTIDIPDKDLILEE